MERVFEMSGRTDIQCTSIPFYLIVKFRRRSLLSRQQHGRWFVVHGDVFVASDSMLPFLHFIGGLWGLSREEMPNVRISRPATRLAGSLYKCRRFLFSDARPIVWGDRCLRVTLLETSVRKFSTLKNFKNTPYKYNEKYAKKFGENKETVLLD